MPDDNPRQCDHAIHLTNSLGQRQGSWIDSEPVQFEGKDRVRVACVYCGRFYGYYLVDGNDRPPGRLEIGM